jgi:hypothetical protein
MISNLENIFENVAQFENKLIIKITNDLYDQNTTEVITNKMFCELLDNKDLHINYKNIAVAYLKKQTFGIDSDC